MKYEEVLPAVLEGKFVRPDKTICWVRMMITGEWETEKGTKDFVPREFFRDDTWEVKPQEIYIWGVSVKDKDQYISYLGQSYMTEFWSKDLPSHNLVKISNNPIFPIDKPKKYKLVPVEDDE